MILNNINFTSDGGNKAPKNAKGSKTNYNSHSSSLNNSYIKSSELLRQNKNKTQSQQKQIYKTLEGAIVNNYIREDNKNPHISMDDICNSLVISDNFQRSAYNQPVTEVEKKEEKNSTILRSAAPLIAASLALVGGALGLTAIMKKSASSLNNPKLLRSERLPNLGMNMNIKQEHEFGTYMALRNPNKKTILAMIGIFLTSGITLIGKNLVDGIQEIWLKKKEADADKVLQEDLINIEARTFAGKLDIIREELTDKANYFKEALDLIPEGRKTKQIQDSSPFLNFFGFMGNKSKIFTASDDALDDKKSDIKNSPLLLAALTITTLAAGVFAGRKMFKNIVAADSEIRKYVNNETDVIEKKIKALSDKIKTAQNKDAAASDIDVLKNLLQIKRANSIETGEIFSEFDFLNEKDIQNITGEVMTGIKSIYGDAPETLGGKVGQIQYYCYLDETRGHVYNWIMNPENPFTGYLVLALGAVNAAGYSIKKAIEGMKEAAVIKENKNTEKQLQERLIDTEIRNFKAKKESAIKPLMDEFNLKLDSGASKEELKNMADNILLEIKNGPPFVYS